MKKIKMNIDDVKGILSEHYTSYLVVVINEDTKELEFRYPNLIIGKALCTEAASAIKKAEVDIEWEEYEYLEEDEDE